MGITGNFYDTRNDRMMDDREYRHRQEMEYMKNAMMQQAAYNPYNGGGGLNNSVSQQSQKTEASKPAANPLLLLLEN